MRDAALGDGNHTVSDSTVARHADLSSKDHVLADMSGAGKADLGAEQRVFADGAAVADVDEVVELGSACDASRADAGAIDAGVGLQFDIILDDDCAGLLDFKPVADIILGEAETIAADDDTVLEKHVVAEAAKLANYGVGVGKEVVADLRTAIDHDMGEDDGMVSDFNRFIDHNVGADMRMLANFRRGVNHRRRMYTGHVSKRRMKQLYRLGPSEIGILAAEHGGGNRREIIGDNDGRGSRCLRGSRVLDIRYEGEVSRASFFDGGNAGDFCVGRAVLEAGAKRLGELRKSHKCTWKNHEL